MKKFEFVLYINGNIICQRYFSVRNYEKEVKNSMDLRWCVDECVKLIEDDLLSKTKDYLYRQYNPWKEQSQEEIDFGKENDSEKETNKNKLNSKFLDILRLLYLF